MYRDIRPVVQHGAQHHEDQCVLLARGLNSDFLPGDHASVLARLRRVPWPDHGRAVLTSWR